MSHKSKLYFLIGPSGAGKDTLLREIKSTRYAEKQPLVAHRYITRPQRMFDENHIELSTFDFHQRKESGLFLFEWCSHGNQYGIGREIKKWIKSGNDVIVNGSREYLSQARKIHPSLIPIWITVAETVLYQRLSNRGRETEADIELRIQRNRELELTKPESCVLINNDQSIEDTVGQIIALTKISTI